MQLHDTLDKRHALPVERSCNKTFDFADTEKIKHKMKIDYKSFKLTAEEKKILKANASHFSTAYKADYTLPLYQRDLIALNDMYVKYLKGKPYNLSCPKCILKLCKAMYPLAEANDLV